MRPRYADVVATLALIIALGGGAYAATKVGSKDIKRNAVRAKHIKAKQVRAKHLRDGSVTAPKLAPGLLSLADGSVGSAALADGAVGTADLADGAVTGAKVDEASLGKVPDADQLDGLDSAELLRGRVRSAVGSDAVGDARSAPVVFRDGELTLECREPASISSVWAYRNTTGERARMWIERVRGDTSEHTVVEGFLDPDGEATAQVSGPVVSTGQSVVTITAITGRRVTQLEARLRFADATCHYVVLVTEAA